MTYKTLCPMFLLVLALILKTSNAYSKPPHVITSENFAVHFHVSFDELQQLLVTPSIEKIIYTKPTTPFESVFLMFYNSQVEDSMEARQLYHDFYGEYSLKLVDLLKMRGAKDHKDFQYGITNAVHISEIDCAHEIQICNFFKIEIYPTFFYFTGGNPDDDMSKVIRQVYVYTSWISIQEMIFFVMKAYSHKMIDISRIKPFPLEKQAQKKKKKVPQLETMAPLFISTFMAVALLGLIISKVLQKKKIQQPQIKENRNSGNKQLNLQKKIAIEKQEKESSNKGSSKKGKKKKA